MVTSIVVMAVGAGGTVAYYFIDTDPNRSEQATDAKDDVQVVVTPIVTPSQGGLGVVGSF